MNIISVRVINNNIQVLNDFLLAGRPKTYLSAAIAADSAATISVFDISGFSAGDYYCYINPAAGNAELIKMHASTSPSGTTITLASNPQNAHDANEPVCFVNYNQIEFSNAATATGEKTVLATQDVHQAKKWSVYCDAADATGYAFARFKNEAGNAYSGYSAAAPYANAAFNTVEYIINEAMDELQMEWTEKITPNRCIKWLNECLRDIRRYKTKISWAQSFESSLGQTEEAKFQFSPPTDIYDKYSRKAIEALRQGHERELIYVTPTYFFDVLLDGVNYTQVRTAASAGDTTLEIDNSYNFDDDGSVNINGNTITYTGITRSSTAGVLTGVPASGTGAIPAAGIAVDDWVFQGETSGQPAYWTMFNGYLYIWPLPDGNNDNFDLFADYWKTITAVDSLDDVVDEIQHTLIKYWLKWQLRAQKENSGKLDLDDTDYKLYGDNLITHIKKDRNLNRHSFRNTYEDIVSADGHNPRKYREGN